MSFIAHLEVLRWHIVRSVLAIIALGFVAFISKDFVFNELILAPKSPNFFTNKLLHQLAELTNLPFFAINSTPFELINITMAGQFLAHIWISIILGVIVASPYVIWEIWRFIKPALKANELKHARGASFFMALLFILGALFGYFIIAPLSINFLSNYSVSDTVTDQIKLSSYVSLLSTLVLASGIIFELPVFVYFFSKIGMITSSGMRKYRRHAFVALLILSAIITPPDVFSQILICIPLVFLYELGIRIAKRVEKNNQLN